MRVNYVIKWIEVKKAPGLNPRSFHLEANLIDMHRKMREPFTPQLVCLTKQLDAFIKK